MSAYKMKGIVHDVILTQELKSIIKVNCLILSAICGTSGERLDGVDSEAAALKLRGRAGTSVTVKLHSVMIHLSFLQHIICLFWPFIDSHIVNCSDKLKKICFWCFLTTLSSCRVFCIALNLYMLHLSPVFCLSIVKQAFLTCHCSSSICIVKYLKFVLFMCALKGTHMERNYQRVSYKR